ncbi:MAG: TonB-dependent receptor domain-containing protein [Sphingomonadaceae bacterium]
MADIPPPDPPAILVSAPALTPATAGEAFGRLTLGPAELATASGRVEESIRGLGGVQLFRASSTRTANPTAEGLTARGLAGNAASRVLVTLDGAPLADPFFGFVGWGALAGRSLASAELVRGGGLGGSGGLAGTLALASAPPANAGRARGASRGSAELEASLALPVEAGQLGLFGGLSRGDGHLLVAAPGPADAPAAYRRWSLGADAKAEAGALTLTAGLSGFSDRRLRGVVGATIESRGGDARIGLVHAGAWRVEALLHAQLRDFATVNRTLDPTRTIATTTLDQRATPAWGWGGRVELTPPLGPEAALVLGLEGRAAGGETWERFRYVAGQPTRIRRAGGTQATAGLFADGSVRLSDELVLSAAARIDGWRIGAGRLEERDVTSGALTLDEPSPARSGLEPTGRLGLMLRPAEAPALRLRAAAWRGWRLPTLNELHRPFRAGLDATSANPALAPERLWGAEGGIGWQASAGVDLSLTAFANRLSGAIANVTLAEGPGTFPGVGFVAAGGRWRQRQNLRAIDSHGLEADLRIARGPWSLVGSGALVSARVSGGGLDGRWPAQAPRLTGSVALGNAGAGHSARLTLRHQGARFEDDVNDRRLPGATTLDAEAALRLAGRLWLEAAAENLANARVATGLSGAQFERGQPRTLWLGLALRR